MPPETARLMRLYLERLALKIERIATNETYKSAFRTTARLVREAKPD